MQEPSNLGKIVLVSIWFRMGLTQIVTRVCKDSFKLTYPSNINIWLMYPLVGSLMPLLVLIIDTIIRLYMYHANIGPHVSKK